MMNKSQEVSLDMVNFKYHDYNIIIKFDDSISVYQYNTQIPLIYSDKQEIIIKEGIQTYEFKFKSDSYNNDILYIYSKDNYIALDKCDKEGSNLICRIQSDRLEENLGNIDNNDKYTLNIMNDKLRNRECK